LAWVHKVPLPNVAEDVGVSIVTVKRVLKEMMKANIFEKRCAEMEKKWTK
jgi:predicted transcriptional regulator